MPARGAPNRYPGVQKKVIKLIEAAAEPGAIIATAVGRVTKKLPFAQPLIRAKMNSGGSDSLTGQMANMLRLLMRVVIARALTAPTRSQNHPPNNLPIAVAAPNPATRPAPTEDD